MKIKTYHHLILIAVIILVSGLTSCIENDIPYARIAAGFTAISAEGETASAEIDNDEQLVTLTLGESIDPASVNITSYSITDGASISADITGGIDLTDDYTVTISLYQDYEWIIRANQTIERYFTIPGQVGSSTVDAIGKRIVAYMPDGTDLTAITVSAIKLGPSDISTMNPDLNNSIVDFSQPVEIIVSYRDETETWTAYVETTETLVSLDRVDAWTNVMWLYGSAQEGLENGFEYRLQGDDDWTRLDQSSITNSGGEFSACVAHLSADTSYEVRAYSDENYSDTWTVMTEGEIELPNMSFDEWWYENDRIWNPWSEDGTSFWDTGNDGAATFAQFGIGGNVTQPDTDTWDGSSGYSAKLETDYVVVKLAGGNIFSGEYVRTDGTNGVLNFGREFTGRPTRLKGHWKYTSTDISHSSDDDYRYMIGQPDTAVVYVALINSEQPIEIRTNPNSRQLFDSNASYVIAYGEIQSGESISEWTDFDIELEYRQTNSIPTYIIIVCTASKYADYFTGGEGSTLWIDDFSLGWDY